MQADWIAVDWGTSNMRAWGIDSRGAVVTSGSSPRGMGSLEPSQYSDVLNEVIGPWLRDRNTDILVCGMAGARQGWVEAPYLDSPADLRGLGVAAVPVPSESGSVRILPGVCQKTPGAENVMRGEETQLLGLGELMPNFSGLVCMPGTHCKWAELDGTRLVGFSTAMTGELFAILSTHSVLRHSVTLDEGQVESDEGFDAGVMLGLERPQDLSSLLFSVRAGSLLSRREPNWCRGYLSGLLIGAEIGARRDVLGTSELPLIGAPALCARYARAIDFAGGSSRILDATETTLAGLRAARRFGG
jgi:2-dehydro-3-deoxygalactonokinase